MAMGCHAIVAEGLTITGSIGVVAATFNLKEVYRRIGFTKEVISRGRSAVASPARESVQPAMQASAALWADVLPMRTGLAAVGADILHSDLQHCSARSTWMVSSA